MAAETTNGDRTEHSGPTKEAGTPDSKNEKSEKNDSKNVWAMALDVVVPIAGYFILHAFGINDFWSLTIAGIATGVVAGANTLRRKKLDHIGILIVLEVVLTGVLAIVYQDPRFILVKPSFYTAVAGVYFLITCFRGKPFCLEPIKPMAAAGDDRLTAAYDSAWDRSARFRRELRLITAVWGVIWLLESATRVVLVYNLSISEGVIVSAMPLIVAFVLAVLFARVRINAVRRGVEDSIASAPAPA
jgi:hypothetical protein